ncbi:hypothetical protein AcV7_005012 [Taiwanofungus camphoratus]|nr:hypothetical protein AcV7_005012 [Antrodia cinnamomea]
MGLNMTLANGSCASQIMKLLCECDMHLVAVMDELAVSEIRVPQVQYPLFSVSISGRCHWKTFESAMSLTWVAHSRVHFAPTSIATARLIICRIETWLVNSLLAPVQSMFTSLASGPHLTSR